MTDLQTFNTVQQTGPEFRRDDYWIRYRCTSQAWKEQDSKAKTSNGGSTHFILPDRVNTRLGDIDKAQSSSRPSLELSASQSSLVIATSQSFQERSTSNVDSSDDEWLESIQYTQVSSYESLTQISQSNEQKNCAILATVLSQADPECNVETENEGPVHTASAPTNNSVAVIPTEQPFSPQMSEQPIQSNVENTSAEVGVEDKVGSTEPSSPSFSGEVVDSEVHLIEPVSYMRRNPLDSSILSGELLLTPRKETAAKRWGRRKAQRENRGAITRFVGKGLLLIVRCLGY